MKAVVKIIIFLLLNNLYAQEIPKGWALAEIFIITKGLTENGTDSMRYKMEAVSVVWKADETIPYSNYQITNEFDIAYYPKLKYKGVRNTPDSHFQTLNVLGFNFLFESQNEPEPKDMDSYGWGLYKLTAIYKSSDGTITEKGSIFLDFRDCRYPSYPAPVNGHGTDIWIKFDATGSGSFSYRSEGPQPSSSWTQLNYKQYMSIWDIKNQIIQGSPQTNQFPNYWQNCLVVIPKKASDEIEVPYLVWGPIPNFQVTGYKIYCSINTQGGPPGNFNLIAQVDANTTEYMHEGLTVGNCWKVYYKVKAFNDSNESGFTNIAEIGVSGFYKDNSNNTVDNYNFNLYPNHPNPFNPTTIIKYQLPEDAHVNLIIYDILGRKVTTLVNEFKKFGSYEVEFDAHSNVRVGHG